MNLPLKDYLIGGAIIALVAGVLLYGQNQRHAGELAIRSHQADSTHKVDSLDGLRKKAERVAADLRADSVDRAAKVQVARAAAQKARADSAAQASSDARVTAERLLADSLATVAQLRASNRELIDKGRADSLASAQLHAEDQSAMLKLTQDVAAQKTAKEKAIDEVNTVTRRAVDAERQRDIARQQLPSGITTWGTRGVAVAAIVVALLKK